jgi:hypothetical protein
MIGSSILDALLATELYVITVLTRSAKTQQFPSTVRVVEVDYSSLDSLVTALQNQEVLVSALAKVALGNELLLIDAAFLANVQRVVPSEFGGDLLNQRTRQFPNYRDKILVQDRLKLYRRRTGPSMSYTLVFNNVLLDWSLTSGLILDPHMRLMHRYNDGNTMFSTTLVSTVGHAVAGVLENFQATENRAVYIQDLAITQNELLSIIKSEIESLSHKTTTPAQPAEAETSSAIRSTNDGLPVGSVARSLRSDWKLVVIDTARAVKEAQQEIAAGASPSKLFYSFATQGAFVDGYGGHFQCLDNELLGVRGLSKEGLRAVIRATLAEA